MSHDRIDRRTFLQAAAALGIGVIGAGPGRGGTTGGSAPRPRLLKLDAVVDGKRDYDYIVIGSGAGGGPVAANLARAGYEVLVLEAGGMEAHDPVYSVPAWHLLASEDPRMNWNFFVKHYTDRARHGRRFVEDEGGMLYPRASTVGGCTAHHVMLTLYPENRDWDDIVALTGDRSWNSYNMRRYFERVKRWLPIEGLEPSLALEDRVVARLATAAALETGLAGRALDLDFDLNRFSVGGLNLLDPNDLSHIDALREGLYTIPQSTEDGERRGARERLLGTMQAHPDRLFMQTHALVERLALERQPDGTLRALGVDFLHRPHLYEADPMREPVPPVGRRGGFRHHVTARREVIVAAGAFNSPQLLMLSGIGPADHLRRHGIPARLDLPGVGENLQDRYEVSVVTEFDRPFDLARDCTFGEGEDPCLDAYRTQPANRLYASNGLIAGVKKRFSRGRAHPEMFVFCSPGRFEGYEPGFAQKGLMNRNFFTWAILKGYAQNDIGTVRLRSADPTAAPDINFRYFNDGEGGDYDLDAVQEGLELARAINERAASMGWLDAARGEEVFPGPGITSKADLRDFIRKEAWGHHASCSNKLGHADDPKAVVDPRFKVRGTANVRVVDASVFPKIPGLFIVLPVYMIAEKASDDILRDAAGGV